MFMHVYQEILLTCSCRTRVSGQEIDKQTWLCCRGLNEHVLMGE